MILIFPFPMLPSACSRFFAVPGATGAISDAIQLGRLNHIAIAVPDLDVSVKLWQSIFGLEASKPVPQEEHGVYTVFIDLPNTKIELIHPLGEKSPISNFLEKNKSGGIHHVSIEVEDVNSAMETLKSKGVRILGEKPKIGADGVPVIFLHPKDTNGVLIELEQHPQK